MPFYPLNTKILALSRCVLLTFFLETCYSNILNLEITIVKFVNSKTFFFIHYLSCDYLFSLGSLPLILWLSLLSSASRIFQFSPSVSLLSSISTIGLVDCVWVCSMLCLDWWHWVRLVCVWIGGGVSGLCLDQWLWVRFCGLWVWWVVLIVVMVFVASSGWLWSGWLGFWSVTWVWEEEREKEGKINK